METLKQVSILLWMLGVAKKLTKNQVSSKKSVFPGNSKTRQGLTIMISRFEEIFILLTGGVGSWIYGISDVWDWAGLDNCSIDRGVMTRYQDSGLHWIEISTQCSGMLLCPGHDLLSYSLLVLHTTHSHSLISNKNHLLYQIMLHLAYQSTQSTTSSN